MKHVPVYIFIQFSCKRCTAANRLGTKHICCMAVILYVDIHSLIQYVLMKAQVETIIIQLFDVVSKQLAIDADSLFQLHKPVQRLYHLQKNRK